MSDQRVILIVDDDPDIRDTISDLLDDAGHAIVTASNGREALTLLDDDPLPCLILLDIMMPVMDGYEFLEERRKNPRIAAIPVIVLTAGGRPDPKRLGDVPFFRKPISLQDLRSAITAHC